MREEDKMRKEDQYESKSPEEDQYESQALMRAVRVPGA